MSRITPAKSQNRQSRVPSRREGEYSTQREGRRGAYQRRQDEPGGRSEHGGHHDSRDRHERGEKRDRYGDDHRSSERRSGRPDSRGHARPETREKSYERGERRERSRVREERRPSFVRREEESREERPRSEEIRLPNVEVMPLEKMRIFNERPLAAKPLTNAENPLPEILAPAGDISCFLAALAAGADAVYVGPKHFSARANADNFSTSELARMVELANSEGRRVYIAFNSLLKPGDMEAAGRMMKRLDRDVHPHGFIVQDLGLLELARQSGYEGQLHLSTLANITHPGAVAAARALGASRVVLPRELSIDEIRQVSDNCPEDLDLELFVHGALCWCVSGRCYWSSYLGGKSGLRGRCVQPCRRVYDQKGHEGRFFSCQDLSLDVLVRTLLDMPRVRSWKIEGRKKGPHYVYHAVSAYKLLRDNGNDPRARKDAAELLEMALGRPSTHARFLPQKDNNVTAPEEPTTSGMLVGKIQFTQGDRDNPGQPYFKPRQELLPRDFLRIGHEDEPWHTTLPVMRRVPKAGDYLLRLSKHKTPKAGTPVFLIDRREPEMQAVLKEWEGRFARTHAEESHSVTFTPRLPAAVSSRKLPDLLVRSTLPQGKETRGGRAFMTGLWVTPSTVRATSRTVAPRISWWMPPVIWPEEEDNFRRYVNEALRNGGRHFVLNAPWQVNLFERERLHDALHLTAGPFCNASNAAAIAVLAGMGFESAFVSPELSRAEMLSLPRQSCLPLGAVLSGWWPVGISRHKLFHLKPNEPFASPKGEIFWARHYGQNTWLYPGWPLDLEEHRPEMEGAGYCFFANLDETLPASLPEIRRTSLFNWDGQLL